MALRYLTKCTYEVTFNDWGRVVLVSTFSTLLYRFVAIHTNGSLLVASSDYCNFASSYQSSLSILHSIPKWLLGEDMPLSVRSVAVLHTKSKSLLLRTSSFLFRKSRSSPGFVVRQHLGPKNHLDFFCWCGQTLFTFFSSLQAGDPPTSLECIPDHGAGRINEAVRQCPQSSRRREKFTFRFIASTSSSSVHGLVKSVGNT